MEGCPPGAGPTRRHGASVHAVEYERRPPFFQCHPSPAWLIYGFCELLAGIRAGSTLSDAAFQPAPHPLWLPTAGPARCEPFPGRWRKTLGVILRIHATTTLTAATAACADNRALAAMLCFSLGVATLPGPGHSSKLSCGTLSSNVGALAKYQWQPVVASVAEGEHSCELLDNHKPLVLRQLAFV